MLDRDTERKGKLVENRGRKTTGLKPKGHGSRVAEKPVELSQYESESISYQAIQVPFSLTIIQYKERDGPDMAVKISNFPFNYSFLKKIESI